MFCKCSKFFYIFIFQCSDPTDYWRNTCQNGCRSFNLSHGL